MGSLTDTYTMSTDKLSTLLIGNYQDAFNRFCSKDGLVSSTQIKAIFKFLGQNPCEAELQDMINLVDKDGTSTIDFPEFLQMMALKFESENVETEIRTAFSVFDGDGNGYISRHELATVMNNMGEKLSTDEIQAMIDEA